MKTLFTKTFSTLAFVIIASGATFAHAEVIIADWNFNEANLTTLNNTANTGTGLNGAGSSWDVAITGLSTNGSGVLNVQNAGAGGSGTRSSYADFGPYPEQITSGLVSLYATFSGWNVVPNGSNFPAVTLGFIEGNSFSTAQFSLAADNNGLNLSGGVDDYSDGAAIGSNAHFNGIGRTPLTVRLDVNLDLLNYALSYNAGAGFISLGSAAVDSLTLGVNSLRIAFDGDFTGSGVAIDRIWAVQSPNTEVPEPATLLMTVVGLLLMAALTRQARSAN